MTVFLALALVLADAAPTPPPSPDGGPVAIAIQSVGAELMMTGISAVAAKPSWHGNEIAAVYFALPGLGVPVLDLALDDGPPRAHVPAFVYGASLLALAAANLLVPANTSSTARFWMNFGGQNAAMALTIATAALVLPERAPR